MRTLKDKYEIRLTQLTKSAKTEISRLVSQNEKAFVWTSIWAKLTGQNAS